MTRMHHVWSFSSRAGLEKTGLEKTYGKGVRYWILYIYIYIHSLPYSIPLFSRTCVYPSAGSLPPLVIGNEDFAHIGIPAEIQNRQSSGHSPPLTEGSDELPRSASTQPISSFRRQSSAFRPPDGLEVGERQRYPKATRGSRHSSTSPRTTADSHFSNTPSWAAGSPRDPAHLPPWLANSAVGMRPSEMEDTDILPKLPHKPRHPGDLY